MDKETEAKEASFFDPLENFRERLALDIAEVEETQTPKIKNLWIKNSAPFFALIEFSHCDPAVDPQSPCRGRMITKVDLRGKNETKKANCPQCQQEISINLTILQLQLRLI